MKEFNYEQIAQDTVSNGMEALQAVKEFFERAAEEYNDAARKYADSFQEEINGAMESLEDIEAQTNDDDEKIKSHKARMSGFLIRNKQEDVEKIEDEIRKIEDHQKLLERRADSVKNYVPAGDGNLYKEAVEKWDEMKAAELQTKKIWRTAQAKLRDKIDELEALYAKLNYFPQPKIEQGADIGSIKTMSTSNRNASECIGDYIREQKEKKARQEAIEAQKRFIEGIRARQDKEAEKPEHQSIFQMSGKRVDVYLAEDGSYYDQDGKRYMV